MVENIIEGLDTAEALSFANLRRSNWNNAIGRGLYTEAPTVGYGRVRTFDVDDLVAAFVMGQLFERKVLPKFACQIAGDVRRELRKSDNIKTLSAWKVFNRKGQPRVIVAEAHPEPDAKGLFLFEVAEIRKRARAGIQAKIREHLRQQNT